MSSTAPDATVRRRPRPTSPEGVATVLSIVVVVAVVVFLGPLRGGPGAAATPPPDPTAPGVASANASGPPVASGEPTGSVLPSTSAAPFAAAARNILQADTRLLAARDDLRSAVEDDDVPTTEIRRQLPPMNLMLVTLARMTDAFDGSPEAEAVVADLAEIHDDVAALIRETQRTSHTAEALYRARATEVVDRLDALEAVMDRLAEVSGLPPS